MQNPLTLIFRCFCVPVNEPQTFAVVHNLVRHRWHKVLCQQVVAHRAGQNYSDPITHNENFSRFGYMDPKGRWACQWHKFYCKWAAGAGKHIRQLVKDWTEHWTYVQTELTRGWAAGGGRWENTGEERARRRTGEERISRGNRAKLMRLVQSRCGGKSGWKREQRHRKETKCQQRRLQKNTIKSDQHDTVIENMYGFIICCLSLDGPGLVTVLNHLPIYVSVFIFQKVANRELNYWNAASN